jgi:hypothetical protein
MRLRIVSGSGAASKFPGARDGLVTLAERPGLVVQAAQVPRSWTDADGSLCFLLGDVIGVRGSDGGLLGGGAGLKERCFQGPEGLAAVEGRFVFVKVSADDACEVWADRFGSVDLYHQSTQGVCVVGSGLDLMPVSKGGAAPSAMGFAHALTVYGSRPAKQHTLYEGVGRLGVDQGARLIGGRLELLERPFRPLASAAYGQRELHEYADTLLEAVRARGSANGNVVHLSSGWDSTAILACLVHLYGARKVRAVIGRMQYADRSGVINQFEMDRARAVADFFGVRLDVCELDYRKGAEALVERAQPIFLRQQFATLTGLNHMILAEHTAATSGGDEAVFVGEMSDGAHNLGFSQFVTIFHPVQDFREYSDKMLSYLFGPTFLAALQKGEHQDDLIWQIFKSRMSHGVFDELAPDAEGRARQLLASFFLRGNRFPLWSMDNSSMLTPAGRSAYTTEMENTYLSRASKEVTPDTLYAWYLHLYNSFHWQGSTVATLHHTLEEQGMRCALPFHDGAVMDFLSAMPESWGRGLDLKPTKYPLKWMLENRVRYPMHLQVGPHSYLYDVDRTFSHSAEILYGSSLADIFKERFKRKDVQQWLDPSVFDTEYVDRIVARYLKGEEFHGAEMNDVLMLGMVAMTGSYV